MRGRTKSEYGIVNVNVKYYFVYYIFYINDIIIKVITTLTLTIAYPKVKSPRTLIYARVEKELTLTIADVNVRTNARNERLRIAIDLN